MSKDEKAWSTGTTHLVTLVRHSKVRVSCSSSFASRENLFSFLYEKKMMYKQPLDTVQAYTVLGVFSFPSFLLFFFFSPFVFKSVLGA